MRYKVAMLYMCNYLLSVKKKNAKFVVPKSPQREQEVSTELNISGRRRQLENDPYAYATEEVCKQQE